MIIIIFSDNIRVEFGLDKCAKASFVCSKLTAKESIQIYLDTTIEKLEPEESYKYLVINEGDGIQHSHMKEKIRKEYYRRLQLVTNSKLNASNRIDAMNTLAVPVVTCNFNIIDWTKQELQRMNRKTCKIITVERMHHPQVDKDRMYVYRSKGGRGLIQLETTYKLITIGLDT